MEPTTGAIDQQRKFLIQTVTSIGKTYRNKLLPDYIRTSIQIGPASTQVGIYKKHLIPLVRKWAASYISHDQLENLDNDSAFISYLADHHTLLEHVVGVVQPKWIPPVITQLIHNNPQETPPVETEADHTLVEEIGKEPSATNERWHPVERKDQFEHQAVHQPDSTTPQNQNQDQPEAQTITPKQVRTELKPAESLAETPVTIIQPSVVSNRDEDRQPPAEQNTPTFTQARNILRNIPRPRVNLPVSVETFVRRGVFRGGAAARNIVTNVGSRLVNGTLGTMQGTGMIPTAGPASQKAIARLLLRRAAGQAAVAAARTALFATPVGWAILGIGLFFILIIIMIPLMKSNALLEVQNPNAPAFPDNSGSVTLAQCEFTRGDLSPESRAAKYQSTVLMGYFQEASQKSGVPAQVLAAIARVESPGIVNFTDQTLGTFNCAESPTGALGLMQIQPAGTTGNFSEGLDLGASYLGKTAAQLTRADFCDVRSSVTLASGFIIKKMKYLYQGDGQRWDPAWTTDREAIYAVANGYYGCLSYPSCSSGPHNYGADIWAGISACKPSSSTPTPTPPADVADLRGKINSEFGLSFQESPDFDKTVLTWAWDALWKARNSAPNFFTLMKKSGFPTISIIARPGVSTETFNGSGFISINTEPGKSTSSDKLFKQILIHELGHIIHGPSGSPRDKTFDSGLIEAQKLDEDVLTRYSISVDESFAELVSYYVHRDYTEQPTYDSNVKWPNANPLQSGKYPAHLDFIRKLLGAPSGNSPVSGVN